MEISSCFLCRFRFLCQLRQLLQRLVFHDDFHVFQIEGTHRGHIYPVACILGENVADFVELLRCVAGFADDEMVLSGQRVLVEAVFSVVMALQNMGGAEHGIKIPEPVKPCQIKGCGVGWSGFGRFHLRTFLGGIFSVLLLHCLFLGIADLVDYGNRVLVVRSEHLGAIVPIRLVPVIFFRVVRSGQDNTALASQLADGI